MVQNTTLPGGDDGNPVMYEELAEVEKKFEDVDIWLSRFIGLVGFFVQEDLSAIITINIGT